MKKWDQRHFLKKSVRPTRFRKIPDGPRKVGISQIKLNMAKAKQDI